MRSLSEKFQILAEKLCKEEVLDPWIYMSVCDNEGTAILCH